MRDSLSCLLIFLLSSPLFATTKVVQVPIKVNRRICDQLLVRHVPADDVAYQPGVDVDGNPVVPADVEGSVQLKLPQEITIPIEIDLRRYYREPSPNLQRNFSQLDTNQQSVVANQQALNSNFSTLETAKATSGSKLAEIQNKVISNGTGGFTITADQLKAEFDALAEKLNSMTSTLATNTQPVSDTINSLQNTQTILEKRIQNNPLEKDVTILQENQKFLDQGRTSIADTQTAITTNSRLINETQELLDRATTQLADTRTQGILGTTNLAAVNSTFTTLQDTLNSVKNNSTNVTNLNTLSSLTNSLNTLSALQIRNFNELDIGVRKAYVGEVKVDLTSGRVTFNGQPLTDPQREQLIAKCKEKYR